MNFELSHCLCFVRRRAYAMITLMLLSMDAANANARSGQSRIQKPRRKSLVALKLGS